MNLIYVSQYLKFSYVGMAMSPVNRNVLVEARPILRVEDPRVRLAPVVASHLFPKWIIVGVQTVTLLGLSAGTNDRQASQLACVVAPASIYYSAILPICILNPEALCTGLLINFTLVPRGEVTFALFDDRLNGAP